MDSATKVREINLRRKAKRQGLELHRSRFRDPHALGFGTYQLVRASTGELVAGDPECFGFGLTLDDIEAWLTK